MKVKILTPGAYALFGKSAKVKAQELKAGDMVDFPEVYADGIVKAGLAEAVIGVVEMTTPVELEIPKRGRPRG